MGRIDELYVGSPGRRRPPGTAVLDAHVMHAGQAGKGGQQTGQPDLLLKLFDPCRRNAHDDAARVPGPRQGQHEKMGFGQVDQGTGRVLAGNDPLGQPLRRPFGRSSVRSDDADAGQAGLIGKGGQFRRG